MKWSLHLGPLNCWKQSLRFLLAFDLREPHPSCLPDGGFPEAREAPSHSSGLLSKNLIGGARYNGFQVSRHA